MNQHCILVVDDEPHMRRVLEIMLRSAGHTVYVAGNGREALEILRDNPVDLVITDMRMSEMDGIELLNTMRRDGMGVPVILITAHGSVESAVHAMKCGASDYLLRPFDLEELELAIARVLNEAAMLRQNSFLREELNRGWDAFIGTSVAMKAIYELIRQVAPAKAPVMIAGETGTGKELAARAIHNASPRRDKLFVPINCAAIPAEMLEAELFGYEKGAFTGALKDRIGKFELANEGTVFLDELTEMPIALQAKLLRFLQDNTVERLGSNRRIPLNLRIVAATNLHPRDAVNEGRLREDLYYRLNVLPITLTPLRERKEDIPDLLAHFIVKHSPRADGRSMPSAEVVKHLLAYDWPGNVRELENMVERALVLCGSGPFNMSHFPLEPDASLRQAAAPESPITLGPLTPAVEAFEARLIGLALEQAGGSKQKAAALLDISERSLWYKLKKYGPQTTDTQG